MPDYLNIAWNNGLELNLNPDLSGEMRKKRDRLERWFTVLRSTVRGNRVYPRYTDRLLRSNKRVIVASHPNIGTLPRKYLTGNFSTIDPGYPEVITYLALQGYKQEAQTLLDSRQSFGSFLVNALGISKVQTSAAKKAFYHIMWAPPSITQEIDPAMVVCISSVFPRLGKTDQMCRQIASRDLPLLVAADVCDWSEKGLVGFYHDEVLVEGASDALIEELTDRAYGHLADLLGLNHSGSTPTVCDDPLADALQWLKDCGGSMAIANNPMASVLIQEGLAKKGGYDSMGRRIIVLVDR